MRELCEELGLELNVWAIFDELLLTCIRDIRYAGLDGDKAQQIEDSVAWLNGGPAVLPFVRGCELLGYDPVLARRTFARRLGLSHSRKSALILGPYTLEHAEAAKAFIRAASSGAQAIDTDASDGD